MKSAIIMPALLAATALAAAIPESAQIITIPDSTLDAAIAEPLLNLVSSPIAGNDPSSLLTSYDDSQALESPEDAPVPGNLAWAAIELEVAAALESSAETTTGDAERLAETRARDLAEIAKGPEGGAARIPLNRTAPGNNDFHLGITKDQLCRYFRGIAWKTGDLQRPVYQWQYEYVPWLIHNKGPYAYVLGGLRHIEWILWKIERSLQYTTPFTPEEERAIIRCYYEFSGYERQVTRLPTAVPIPVLPRPTPAAAAPTPVTVIPKQRGNAEKTPKAGAVRWVQPHPSMKKLLRLITAKAPVSKYQSYANHRIHNVLRDLEYSAAGAAKRLVDKFQSKSAKDFLIYDIKGRQGLEKAFAQAIEAYQVK